MKIKKFTARTFSEALEQVKKELSENAIILSTEEIKGLRPRVEITAAVDYDNQPSGVRSEPQGNNPELRKEPVPPVPFSWPAGNSELRTTRLSGTTELAEVSSKSPDSELHNAPCRDTAAAGDLRSEVASLRELLEGMKNSGYEMALPRKKKAMMNFLTERAIRPEYALRLCDKATDLEDVPLHISADIKIKRHSGTKKAVMLLGPTGVGKTTTIAKLAAQAVKAGQKAAVINLDTYRIGATEQIRIYSRILGIPIATVSGAAEFKTSLVKFSENRDVVFIDTTGKNPRDEAYIHELAELCKTEVPMELHLLMGANSDGESMIEAYRSYRKLPIDYIAFTKVDEAVRFGSLYNLMLTYQKPVAYITTGQRVPGDLEFATVNRLAGLIVKKEC